jgi:hypothetical protein
MMNRLARLPIPQNRRLTLIRNPDRSYVCSLQTRFPDRRLRCVQLSLPDLIRIMLDPAGLREILPKFLLRHRQNPTTLIKHDRSRTGRTLIQSQNCLSHELIPRVCRLPSRLPAGTANSISQQLSMQQA